MPKTDAQLELAAKKAAAALASPRKDRVDAALTALEPAAALAATLREMRDSLHDGETKNALSSVVSILTSAPIMIRSEQAQLQAVIAAGDEA